jgi:hypothetical protein
MRSSDEDLRKCGSWICNTSASRFAIMLEE